MRCSIVTFSGTENFHIEIFMSEAFSVYSESHWGLLCFELKSVCVSASYDKAGSVI